MNTAVYSHTVVANVRIFGAIGAFERREFDFMIAPDTQSKMDKEAIRILHQIGYETHGVQVQERS